MIILTEDHRYIDEETGREFPGVTATIRSAGLMGWTPNDDWYMERGTAVHAATAMSDRGTLDQDNLDPQIAPYLEAWKAYRRDTGYVPTQIEQIVSDLTIGYCGTMDRDGLDIKTGAAAKWHILQAAAYWHTDELRTDRTTWQSVYLQDDGKYKLAVYRASELHAAFRVFCAALQINQWKKENGIHE